MKPIYFLVIVILLVSCSSAASADAVQTAVAGTLAAQQPSQQEQISSPAVQQPTNTTAQIATREPTYTQVPIVTKTPTLTPIPTYSEPVILQEFGGTGSLVTDNYQWPSCKKAVFYWIIFPGNDNDVNFDLVIHNIDRGLDESMINVWEFGIDPAGFSGSTLQTLQGGEYFFSTENTSEPWTVRVECQDGAAPVMEGMDVQATGPFVSDNYTLTACNKSIFSWSVEPDYYGYTVLHMSLCSLKGCEDLGGGYAADMTGPLTGEALMPVDNGTYYLVAEDPQANWSVHWECRD